MKILSELYQAYTNDDIDAFCSILSGNAAATAGPRVGSWSRKSSNNFLLSGASGQPKLKLSINKLDIAGRTILHIAASEGKVNFVQALVDCPAVDVGIQDLESGWTALHRALYYGNIACAQVIIASRGRETIKAKDKEGFSPFDVLNSTVIGTNPPAFEPATGCSEVYMFGSNRNNNLGFQDGNDKALPSRIHIARTNKKQANETRFLKDSFSLQYKDVVISRFHTAVITNEEAPNIYVCGFGSGGRLGLGDQDSQMLLTPVRALADSPCIAVALGQDHTIALLENGNVFTWGSNKFGQLGFAMETNDKKKDPEQTLPGQVNGLNKVSNIRLLAASRIHSVCATDTELYTWGTNYGQMGYISLSDNDVVQVQPRKVSSLSAPIKSITATDYATVCLLATNEVIVFAAYSYTTVHFPLDSFDISISSLFRPRSLYAPNSIVSLSSGGSTIAAVSSMGDIFTFVVDESFRKMERKTFSRSIKPLRAWSLKRRHLAARSVAVGQDGTILLCTESGSVWMRGECIEKGQTCNGSNPKFKFMRIPNLTRVNAVRGSNVGSFSALRTDVNVEEILYDASTLNNDICGTLQWLNELVCDRSSNEPLELDVLYKKTKAASTLEFLDSTNSNLVFNVNGVHVPAHSIILQGRCSNWELLLKGHIEGVSVEEFRGNYTISVQNSDLLSVMIFVYYIYSDRLVNLSSEILNGRDIVNIRRDVKKLADIFGVPRLANHLKDGYYTQPEPSLAQDLSKLLARPETCDMTIELREGVVKCHSLILMARSQFFGAMHVFRPTGLSSRGRSATENSVNFVHISKHVFDIVLRDIYGEIDESVFTGFKCNSMRDYLTEIIVVMEVANELMLDRLRIVCEKAISVHVNMQNVAWILSETSIYNAEALKKVCFDYCCANMEALLENGLLDDLEVEILMELDKHVQGIQGSKLPATKGGRLLRELTERNPGLEEEYCLSALWREQSTDEIIIGSLDSLPSSHGSIATSWTQEVPSAAAKGRRKSKPTNSNISSPLLAAIDVNDKTKLKTLPFGHHRIPDIQEDIFLMDDEYEEPGRWSRRVLEVHNFSTHETSKTTSQPQNTFSGSLPKTPNINEGWMDFRGKPISSGSFERKSFHMTTAKEPIVKAPTMSSGERRLSSLTSERPSGTHKDHHPPKPKFEGRYGASGELEIHGSYSPTLASYTPVVSKKLTPKEREKLQHALELTPSTASSPWQHFQSDQSSPSIMKNTASFSNGPSLLSSSIGGGGGGGGDGDGIFFGGGILKKIIRSKMKNDSVGKSREINYSLENKNTGKPQPLSNFYDKNQPFGMIIAEQEEELCAKTAAWKVKSMEEIETEAKFDSWWAAETNRVQAAEAEFERVVKLSAMEVKKDQKTSGGGGGGGGSGADKVARKYGKREGYNNGRGQGRNKNIAVKGQ